MVYYSRILQTGVKSLLAVACGWCCGHWGVVDADPTVQYTNTLVLRFCIPCLQIWLLAVKTDMQQADNWRALAAFLLWSLGLQAILVLHQAVTKQRLQLDKLGVDGLILTTNNTGILGPVVLEAAVGAQYAPLGMLATIVLYFQQLPLAQLLFHFHKQQQKNLNSLIADSTAGLQLHTVPAVASGFAPGHKQNGHSKVATSPEPCGVPQEHHKPQTFMGSHGNLGLAHVGAARHLHHTPPGGQALSELRPGSSSSSSQPELQRLDRSRADSRHPADGATKTLDSHGRRQHGRRLSWDLEQQQQGLQTSAAGSAECQTLLPTSLLTQRQQQQRQGLAVYALSLLIKNPLVWSTAIAVLLSALGSAALLDPSSPLALKHLAFLEALLGWFAQTTAPLTLFTTGLWMHSNSQQQQQRQQQGHTSDSNSTSSSSSSSERKPVQNLSYGSQEVAWSEVCVYLLLRATVAPALMVVVCHLMGFRGDLAHALVILALLPVAQTAFVVCKQAETGMAAVSMMLVASLFMMLPQLMVVLAVLERLGVLTGDA